MSIDAGTAPDPADFSVNEKKGEFEVVLYFTGTVRTTVSAADEEAARTQAAVLLKEYKDEGVELDEIEAGRVERCRASRPMYLVTRDGGPMQVSHLQPGDLPRQPTASGF